MAARRILITGTDTGIGKTVAAGLLLRHLRRGGHEAAYFKPVETDAPDGRSHELDPVRRLAGEDAPAVCARTYAQPLAPAVAAAQEDRPVDLVELDGELAALERDHDPVLIEGAGGLLVELAPGFSFRDLAHRWGAEVLLVVGNRLGCLNHAALTAEAIRAAGLAWSGWILNHLTDDPSPAQETNRSTLVRVLGEPLAEIPYPLGDPDAVSVTLP